MVKAIFDSNILIDLLNGLEQADQELERYDDHAISIVTWMEVMAGGPPTSRDLTRIFLDDFELIPLDEDIAERTVELRRQGRLKLPDAIIRASAAARGGLLVTRNTKDFDADDPGVRVPYRL